MSSPFQPYRISYALNFVRLHHRKSKGIFHEVGAHFFSYRICTTFIGKFPMGLILIGYDPINQTSFIGKISVGSNAPKILY